MVVAQKRPREEAYEGLRPHAPPIYFLRVESIAAHYGKRPYEVHDLVERGLEASPRLGRIPSADPWLPYDDDLLGPRLRHELTTAIELAALALATDDEHPAQMLDEIVKDARRLSNDYERPYDFVHAAYLKL